MGKGLFSPPFTRKVLEKICIRMSRDPVLHNPDLVQDAIEIETEMRQKYEGTAFMELLEEIWIDSFLFGTSRKVVKDFVQYSDIIKELPLSEEVIHSIANNGNLAYLRNHEEILPKLKINQWTIPSIITDPRITGTKTPVKNFTLKALSQMSNCFGNAINISLQLSKYPN